MGRKKIISCTASIVYLTTILVVLSGSVSGQRAAKKGNIFAQRLTVSSGFDYSLEESNVPAAAGINLYPQLFLTSGFTDFSLSVAAGAMVNYYWEKKEVNSGKNLFLMIPATLQLNIGHGSSKDFHSAAGGFTGAGWNMQSDGERTVHGFALDAGFRFWLFGKSFTLGFMYFPEAEKIFSSGKIIFLHINLGKYLEDVKANNKVSNFMKPYSK
jgi:hypothetical protein